MKAVKKDDFTFRQTVEHQGNSFWTQPCNWWVGGWTQVPQQACSLCSPAVRSSCALYHHRLCTTCQLADQGACGGGVGGGADCGGVATGGHCKAVARFSMKLAVESIDIFFQDEEGLQGSVVKVLQQVTKTQCMSSHWV